MAHATRAQMKKSRTNIRKKKDGIVYRIYEKLPTFLQNTTPRGAIISGLVVCGLIYGGAVLAAGKVPEKTWTSMQNFALQKSAGFGFRVKDVLITGRENIDKDWLKSSFANVQDAPIFAIDTAKISSVIARHPWVKDVTVQRLWPDRLKINLTERTPALWQVNENDNRYLKLIDKDGQAIGLYNRSAFPELAVVKGTGANKEGLEFIPLLKSEPDIYTRTQTAEFISERRWDLHLTGGITIKLPAHDTGLALRRLALAQELHDILNKNIKAVDMRDSGRIIVEVKDGQNEVLSLTDNAEAL